MLFIGKTDKSVEELDKQFGNLDTQTQENLIIMNKMLILATLEEVCELVLTQTVDYTLSTTQTDRT